MIIDRDYILNEIQEILGRIESKKSDYDDKRTIKKIYQNSPETLRKVFRLAYSPIKFFKKATLINNNNYIFTGDGDFKKWSLDFLNYALKENVSLNTNIFQKEDEEEILKFVNNKIKLAVLSLIKKEELFTKKDLMFEKKYKQYEKQLITGGGKIFFNNKDYFYNTIYTDINTFFHIHGLSELPFEIKTELENKVFVDAGAFFGDSIIVLQQLKPKKIIAFEPSEKNSQELIEMVGKNNWKNVLLKKEGLGEKKKISKFEERVAGSEIISRGNKKIKVNTIDSLNTEINLIKMDIEGSELGAIRGAEKTIKKYKPVLIICLYHRGQDFFEIPKLIKKWIPEYNLRFLNLNRTHPFFERVMLAYVK